MKTKNIDQAIVLAAGLGTRLRPLTDKIAKPALPVGGIPIIFYNLAMLEEVGVRNVVINLHHLPKSIEKLFKKNPFKLKIQFSYEKVLLGTGGGITKAFKMLANKPCFVMNGDILSNIDLAKLQTEHLKKNNIATLAVVNSDYADVKSFVEYNHKKQVLQIAGLPENLTCRGAVAAPVINGRGNRAPTKGIFTGTSIIEPALLPYFKNKKVGCFVRNMLVPALSNFEKVGAHEHKSFWCDLGTLDTLKEIDKMLW